MDKLLYINNQLNFARLEKLLGIQFSDEYLNTHKFTERLWYEPHFPHDRTGKLQMLWDLEVLEQYRMPEFDPAFDKSFEEVTDAKALELEQLHVSTGLPIILNWSGGIDSTCMVVAIHKMCQPSTIKNITIQLNNCSYLENPQFFRDIIAKNFSYTEVSRKRLNPNNCIFVVGDPADQLWIHADIIELMYQFPGANKNNVHTNPDILLKFLETKTDPEHARWFYNFVLSSSHASPVPIVTYEDFYWWANYNFYYCGNSFKAYILDYGMHNADGLSSFMKTHMPWYTGNDYQQWSMHNNSNNIKLANSIASYKEPAKKYIVEVDKNYHYYSYKSKIGGFSMVSTYTVGDSDSIVAVCSNGDLLRMSETERVRELFCTNPRILR